VLVFRLVRVVRITIRDVKVPEWSLGQNIGLRHNLGLKGLASESRSQFRWFGLGHNLGLKGLASQSRSHFRWFGLSFNLGLEGSVSVSVSKVWSRLTSLVRARARGSGSVFAVRITLLRAQLSGIHSGRTERN